MVTMVLLKEAWMWAIPSATCFLTFFFVDLCGLAISLILLLISTLQQIQCSYTKRADPGNQRLLTDRLTRTLTGTCICFSTLTTKRQAATVTDTTVTTEIHQTFDAHLHLTAQVTFNGELTYFATNNIKLIFAQVTDDGVLSDARSGTDLLSSSLTNAIDIGQRDDCMFVVRNVDTGNTGHV